MPRRKTKPETRLRKVQVELHGVKNVVRWAIDQLRKPPVRRGVTDAEMASELARIVGLPEMPVPNHLRGRGSLMAAIASDVYDPADDPKARPDAEHEMMVCSPVAYDKVLAQRERRAKS